MNSAGVPVWDPNGTPIVELTGDQVFPVITTDGFGGAIIAWRDSRSSNPDIYAQRVDGVGNILWQGDGEVVCDAINTQTDIVILADGYEGAFIAWEDGRWGSSHVFLQQVDTAGDPLLAANGIAVAPGAFPQGSIDMITDTAGGVIVTWEDFRNTSDNNIYATRINSIGARMWVANGRLICGEPSDQRNPAIVPDGDGGAYIMWEDDRGVDKDLYAQRVNAAGEVLWTGDGEPVCTEVENSVDATITSDGEGGVIAAWDDRRFSSNRIYGQRIELRHGEWGIPEPVASSASDIPGDQGGFVAVDWLASQRDNLGQQLISHYAVWRATSSIPSIVANNEASVVTLGDIGPDFSGPGCYIEQTPSGEFFWEWIANQTAYYQAGYSMTVPTRGDSVDGDSQQHYFKVSAHTSNQYLFWESNIVSGYSIDNLAPSAPIMLKATRQGGSVVLIEWDAVSAPDLREYAIYRDTSPGVVADPENFLGNTTDTTLTDTGASSSETFHYVVTAIDLHDNESDLSNEDGVGPATGINDRPPTITALQVLSNSPNPFSETTVLRFGLPTTSNVVIVVYDTAGRQVASRHIGPMQEGWRDVPFDGRGADGTALPSGVYFYRVTASGTSVTRKFVIVR